MVDLRTSLAPEPCFSTDGFVALYPCLSTVVRRAVQYCRVCSTISCCASTADLRSPAMVLTPGCGTTRGNASLFRSETRALPPVQRPERDGSTERAVSVLFLRAGIKCNSRSVCTRDVRFCLSLTLVSGRKP
eukprot:1323843-Rhodomonas_salina.5